MAEFQVTVPAGEPLTVVADTATINDGALLLGSGASPAGLFAAGCWASAVDVAKLPTPAPEPAPAPDPVPTPEVPTVQPDPPTVQPE